MSALETSSNAMRSKESHSSRSLSLSLYLLVCMRRCRVHGGDASFRNSFRFRIRFRILKISMHSGHSTADHLEREREI